RSTALVKQLTLAEKINVTTGVDVLGRCQTIPRLNWKGLCFEDSPLGVRFADLASAFPAGINAAATWDLGLIEARGKAMGGEHKGKGVNVALGPMTNLGACQFTFVFWAWLSLFVCVFSFPLRVSFPSHFPVADPFMFSRPQLGRLRRQPFSRRRSLRRYHQRIPGRGGDCDC
ncbi:glycoside hydrolase superfamily, partial [Mycena epipterygia]